MAIEIPTLATDRLAHPEWGTTAPMGRYELPAPRLLAALEGASVSASLIEALRSLAAKGASVDLFLAADRGLVQIFLDGRRVPLAGAARDAVLTLLGEATRSVMTPAAAGRVPAAASLFDPSLAARVATVDAQIQESRSHAADPYSTVLEAEPARPATAISAPLIAAPAMEDPARSLARAVDASGLFLEAHLAQWLRGERSLRQIQDEVRDMPVDAQAGALTSPDRRAAAQFDALQRQGITLAAQAWAGQPVQLEIERDRERHRETANAGEATGLFQATVRMHLRNLGLLQARIRIMDGTIGLQIESDRTSTLAPALQRLAAALTARGLHVAALDLVPTSSGGTASGGD